MSTTNEVLAKAAKRLRDACVGYPHAKIAWPHRILHETADLLDRCRLAATPARDVREACADAAYREPVYMGGNERDESGLLPPGSPYDRGRYDARKAILALNLDAAAPAAGGPLNDGFKFFSENVDRWGASEWFNRLAVAVRDQDKAVLAGDEVAMEICRNVAASSAMRLVRDYEPQVRAALSPPLQAPAHSDAVREALEPPFEALSFQIIERTVVDWLDANGMEAIEEGQEWLFDGDEFKFSITELAAAIFAALTAPAAKAPAVSEAVGYVHETELRLMDEDGRCAELKTPAYANDTGMVPVYLAAKFPAVSEADVGRLNFLTENTNCELLCTGGWGDDDLAWNVHRVNGGRNDREWTLIGSGATPRDAIDAAMKSEVAAHQPQPVASAIVEANAANAPSDPPSQEASALPETDDRQEIELRHGLREEDLP